MSRIAEAVTDGKDSGASWRQGMWSNIAIIWASDPRGVNQVGCVYTAQGFEYDYAGVIFGKDLRYDPRTGAWIGDPNASCDTVVKRSGPNFVHLVKNTYRVLLTRGMKRVLRLLRRRGDTQLLPQSH